MKMMILIQSYWQSLLVHSCLAERRPPAAPAASDSGTSESFSTHAQDKQKLILLVGLPGVHTGVIRWIVTEKILPIYTNFAMDFS